MERFCASRTAKYISLQKKMRPQDSSIAKSTRLSAILTIVPILANSETFTSTIMLDKVLPLASVRRLTIDVDHLRRGFMRGVRRQAIMTVRLQSCAYIMASSGHLVLQITVELAL